MLLMETRKKLTVVSLLLMLGAAAFGFVPSEDQAVRTGLILQKQTKGTKEGGELSLFSSLPSVEKKSVEPQNSPLDAFGRPVKEGPVLTATDAYEEGNVTYDAAGNQTVREPGSGKVQTLTYDALGRLIRVEERDGSNDGFDWTAVYDGFGRRLLTTKTPVAGGTPDPQSAIEIASYFDPDVEFMELGISVDGTQAWKVYGPDEMGAYGTNQGVGNLIAVVDEAGTAVENLITDQLGNVIGRSDSSGVTWHDVELTAYGVGPESAIPELESASDLAETLAWRGYREDPTGLIWMGTRYYDRAAGRFTSPDPLGHEATMGLYSFSLGDPVNFVDADGRLATGFWNGAWEGDYFQADNNAQGFGKFVGQTVAGVIPYVGQAADVRDWTFSAGSLSNEGLNFETGAGIALSSIAFVPGVGDAVKGILKPAVKAVRPYVDNTWNAIGRLFKGAPDAATNIKPGQVASAHPQGRPVAGLREGVRPTDPPSGLRESGAWDLTPENLARMERGQPPLGRDELPVVLHHRGQNPTGPLDELSTTTHRTVDHPLSPSQIDRNQFVGERRRYWVERARELLGQE